MPMTVDAFVKKKVLPEHQEIVRRVRQLMRATVPSATEAFSYGMPVWKGRRILAWIIPTKKDITFGFTRGGSFEDKYGLLRGVGKGAKHIKLKSMEDVNKKVLAYYIKQAVAFDAK
jgi:hypothetical protein